MEETGACKPAAGAGHAPLQRCKRSNTPPHQQQRRPPPHKHCTGRICPWNLVTTVLDCPGQILVLDCQNGATFVKRTFI